MSDRDREKADYFSPAQFLVELRMAVLPVVRTIWESDFVESASSSIAKCLIEILRTVLEGDHEHGAFKRSDKVPARTKATPKALITSSELVSKLADKGYSEELAREALYRCNNNLSAAEEYCNGHRDHALRNPIPSSANHTIPPRPWSSRARRDSEATLPDAVNGAESTQETAARPPTTERDNDAGSHAHSDLQEASSEDVPTESSPPPPAPGVPEETNDAGGDELLPMSIDNLLNLTQIPAVDDRSANSTTSPNLVSPPSRSTDEATTSKLSDIVTIDDLDTERSDCV
jgi:E3 ubiquitin-protein ligase HUWE1